MNDLISRQAAIDAIDRLDIPEDMCVFEILGHIELEIGRLPSAQPNLQPTCNQLATDTISRQAVIDACLELLEARRKWDTAEGRAEMRGIDAVMCAIHDLPSAQPDRCDTCRFVYYPKETNNDK